MEMLNAVLNKEDIKYFKPFFLEIDSNFMTHTNLVVPPGIFPLGLDQFYISLVF